MLDDNNTLLLMSLNKVFKTMDQRCYSAVKDDNLTKNEAIILMFLSNNKSYDTASDIIKIRGLSKAHVAQSIDSLCKKRYLTTCSDQKDRRIQHLIIQPSAQNIVHKLNNARNDYFEAIFEGLDETQKTYFITTVKQVVKNNEKLKEEK